MAIRFRCEACSGLMSISSRKAGAMVQCPTCGAQTLVPMQDIFEAASAPAAATRGAEDSPGESADSSALPEPRRQPDTSRFDPPTRKQVAEDEIGEEQDTGPILDEEEADDDAPALQLKRSPRTDDEMDLTPMVDVTFQLLIFFMVTASFALQKSIEVPTPDQDKKGAAQQLQVMEDIEITSIQIQIDANNAITIDDEAVLDPARLPDLLRDKMRKEQKTELLITANVAALHRSVIAVIDAANEVGMQKIRMASRQAKAD